MTSPAWKTTTAFAVFFLSLCTVILVWQGIPTRQGAVTKISLAREYLLQSRTAGRSNTWSRSLTASSHQHTGTDWGVRCPATNDSVHNLVYISHPGVAETLGCPVNHTLACFYCFHADLPDVAAPPNDTLVETSDCVAVFQPLPADEGRGWCIREGGRPAWIFETIKDGQRSFAHGPVLLTGKLNGPNPTHQANLHFHAIWRWMRKNQILPGSLHMLVDFPNKAWSPGKFGAGMANSLGKVEWLLYLTPGYIHFKQIQFSIPDGRYFPFDLKHMTIDASPDMDYMELAENIKFLVLPPPVAVDNMTVNHMGAPGLATPHDLEGASDSKSDPEGAPGRAARVILARRNAPDNRVWANVEELASELVTGYGLQVEVVSFGAISFEEQVKKVAAVDVLVGVTGSDLVNLMFLPSSGSVVEIFPAVGHEGVFVPELANMAKMLGKNHFPFVTHGNLTAVNERESRLLYRVQELNVGPVSNLAALVNHAAYQTIFGSSLKHSSCQLAEGFVKCESNSA